MPVGASLGKDLIIAHDYVTHGLWLRAEELATLELGPKTDLELRDKLGAEIAAERFTCIDRVMIANRSGCSTFALRRVRCAPISTAR